MFRSLVAACVLVLVAGVVAGCGSSSVAADCSRLPPLQHIACREGKQLLASFHDGYAHPRMMSIVIRGGDWAVIVLQGRFKIAAPCGIGSTACRRFDIARRAQLAFGLRNPNHSWNMGFDFGHGF